MRLIFLGGGIILFIGSILLLTNKFGDLEVEKKGILVKMQIVQIPNSCIGTKTPHFETLNYNGNNYRKRIPTGYCENHTVGELVEMRYLEGNSIVLFPKESIVREIVYFSLLGLLGLSIIFYSLMKLKI